jgi:hypothetical protein
MLCNAVAAGGARAANTNHSSKQYRERERPGRGPERHTHLVAATRSLMLPVLFCLPSLPVLELVAEHRVAADEGYLSAVDEEVADARARFEHVAVGDDEVGDLALLD